MKRNLSLCFLISVFLLVWSISVQAATTNLTLKDATTHDMIVNGLADEPNISIMVIDPNSNQVIGQGFAKADSEGVFSAKVSFNTPLKDNNDLSLKVVATNDLGIGSTSGYDIYIECQHKQYSHQRYPCGVKIYYAPRVGGGSKG